LKKIKKKEVVVVHILIKNVMQKRQRVTITGYFLQIKCKEKSVDPSSEIVG